MALLAAKQKYQFWLTKQADYQKNVDVVESVEAELADEQPWGSAAKQAFDVIDEALAKNPATYLKEREESQGPAAGEADGEQSNAAADATAVGDRQEPELGLGNAPSLNGDGGGGFDEFDFLPSNFILIYSLGSRFDNLIDQESDRHSKIFYSMEEMTKQGYIDASNNDLEAINPKNNKIGLLIH